MGNYLADRRKALNLTQKEVAERIGVSEGTVSRWEGGQIANMRRDRIAAYADVLKTSTNFIMTGEEEAASQKKPLPPGCIPLPRMVKKPLIGDIACGDPITAEQNIAGYVDVPDDVRCDFCLRCKGDSMVDSGIQDGDVVYIRIQPEVEDGQIAAVRIGDEATLKRVYWDADDQALTLVPANGRYRPKTYSGPALDEIQIEGLAVGFTHWF